MSRPFTVVKVLNNNVIIAEAENAAEVIVIGKGIGFGKKRGDTIANDQVDKLFLLANQQEQEEYKQLLSDVDETLVATVHDALQIVRKRLDQPLNERVHIALTDHLSFAIRRLENGIDIENPFLQETELLYPEEFALARDVVDLVNQTMATSLPEGEIGFVALHIHSAISNRSLSEIRSHSELLTALVSLIEEKLDLRIEPNSITYSRLVSHLQQVIERALKGEVTEGNERLIQVLKDDYPLCYNLSWQLIKIIQKQLKLPVAEAEAVYLTLHLQRLSSK
ncbi:glucose PTS transporter transcription antiterminator GlcT [Desertibacillus haloalkaliphilus]|uniref:glucose PTS transporter transcription antiterminator GlcT n=1 Tax=Desertibacillus haloalkaliphilus TaxID=1328930 RepID=UPI001C27F142|nr:PRD domain-containing protein [Desertibacillus haloalkaliphilus]MBU8905096.1 PRD domain-containing protein [Desertibacillus haloalkaliphilus]